MFYDVPLKEPFLGGTVYPEIQFVLTVDGDFYEDFLAWDKNGEPVDSILYGEADCGDIKPQPSDLTKRVSRDFLFLCKKFNAKDDLPQEVFDFAFDHK